MRFRVKGVYTKTKPLACGGRAVYVYHRKSGARIHAAPGTAEFLAEVERLNEGPAFAPVPNSMSALRRRYEASAHFGELAERTRAEYRRALNKLETMIGPFPVADVRRSHVTDIRDKIAKDKPAWANAVVRVLSAVMTFAVDELGWIEASPCTKLRLPRGGDGQLPYTETEIRRFRSLNPYGTRARLAFELMLATAARISDAILVETDGFRHDVIQIISQKSRVLTVAGATEELKRAFSGWEEALRAEGKALGRYALGGANGKPLNRRTLTADLELSYKAAGFPPEKRTHALRYTAATRLYEAGVPISQIQEVTGHAMASMAEKYCRKKRGAGQVTRILNCYDVRGVAN